MKKILLVVLLAGIVSAASAQSTYLSLGTGLNNYNGLLGIGFDIGLAEKVSLRAGVGLGTWGTKIGGGVLFKTKAESDWRIGIGLSSASGLKDFETELETSSGDMQTVKLDLHRQGLFNLSAIRGFESKNGNVFNLEFGFSANISGSKFYTVKDGSELSDVGEQVLEILRPGGLTLAISYMIKLNK